MTQASPLPRLLVRRVLALVIDYLIATVLVIALFLPFTGAGMRLPAPVALRGYECRAVETAPEWLGQILGDTGPYSLRLCQRSLYGLPDGQELRVVLSDSREGASRTSRQLMVPVNAALEPVTTKDWGGVASLLLTGLLSALFIARGRSTPGKRLLGLRIEATGTPRPLWREVLRLWPIVLISLLPLLPGGVLRLGLGLGDVTLIAACFSLALIWYYAWPFVHWTGQSRHDRRAGFRVTRA